MSSAIVCELRVGLVEDEPGTVTVGSAKGEKALIIGRRPDCTRWIAGSSDNNLTMV